MNTDSIVSEHEIQLARNEVEQLGPRSSRLKLCALEPILIHEVDAGMEEIWALLEHYRVLDQLDEALGMKILGVIIRTIQALRYGHYRLWHEEFTDTRLAALDPSLRSSDSEQSGWM